jgi:type I restriction-modification system DNA methylase subunit
MNSNKINLEQNSIGEDFFETRGIFSRHYLKTELPKAPYWPKDKGILTVLEQCRALYLRVQKAQGALNAKGKGLNESDTETELLDKILPLLGFHSLKRSRQATGVPDYVLFADEALKEKALPLPEKERYQFACALLEAKAFNLNLNRISKEDTPGQSYHKQVHTYLQDAKSDKREQLFNWGIVTNGVKWRLYSQESRTDQYFELEVALQDLNAFRYFIALFERDAFIKGDDDLCRLDDLLKESQEGQEKLETDLRKRIFDLVGIISRGFVSITSNNITDKDLPKVYDESLILLYRLLFILYAEGKGLLPVREHGYGARKAYRKDYALRRYQAILKPQDAYEPEDNAFKTYWKDICNLFDLINGSDEVISKRLDIPRYNGGLFDPKKHPELTKWQLGNWTMQEVLKGLIFTPLPSPSGKTVSVDWGETIDYASLEVQRLGSIYEGLLERKLDRVDGEIQLVETSRRKETGSYYTPDWVVDYIIHETVDPLLAKIEESPDVKAGRKDSFKDAVLKLRILDPAMGSGHFLVRATEYLADQIAHHPTTEKALKYDPQGLSEEETVKAFWRRKVVERCIFGVDINPLAVELAKLSLWLTCISPRHTLNFLDPHIRTGNALAGSTIEKIKTGKYKIEGLSEAIISAAELLRELAIQPSDRWEDVRQKQWLWERRIEKKLLPHKRFFNMRTAYDFGIWDSEAAYAADFEAVLRGKTKPLGETETLDSEHRFFHWELAFLEVFNPDNGSPGFDAVIGNPPYERAGILGELKRYLEEGYSVYHGNADLYAYFIEKSLNLLRPEGRFGMIVSNKWMQADYGRQLREFVRKHQIEKIVDFTGLKVFKESTVDTIVISILNQEQIEKPVYTHIKKLPPSYEALKADVEASGYPLEESAFAPGGFTLVRSDAQRILDKMREAGTPLGKYVKGKIYRGILTGFNEAFVIDRCKRDELIAADPASAEIIKPFIKGDDVRKYQINFRERYLIFTRRGIDIDQYPAIKRHLLKWKRELTPKKNKSDEKGRKPGDYEWYEIQDTVAYWQEFEKPTIIWPDITKGQRFAWDDNGLYPANTIYLIPTDNLCLLGILNSNSLWSFLRSYSANLGESAQRLFETYLNEIPIPAVTPSQTKSLTKLVKSRLELTDKLREAFTAKQKADVGDEIEEVEREIDKIVAGLYGLKV